MAVLVHQELMKRQTSGHSQGPQARSYESWLVLSARYLDLARDAGALARLPLALSTRAGADTYARRLSAAASLIGEEHAASPGPRVRPGDGRRSRFGDGWRSGSRVG